LSRQIIKYKLSDSEKGEQCTRGGESLGWGKYSEKAKMGFIDEEFRHTDSDRFWKGIGKGYYVGR
jgi:hypothetical protein